MKASDLKPSHVGQSFKIVLSTLGLEMRGGLSDYHHTSGATTVWLNGQRHRLHPDQVLTFISKATT